MRQVTTEKVAHYLALVFLLYPIMVVKYVPFGGGARYLTVLSSLAAILILVIGRSDAGGRHNITKSLFRFASPFLPLIGGLSILALIHHEMMDLNVIALAVLCSTLMYAALRMTDLTEHHLAFAAAIAGWLYMITACYDVFYLGRDRAWGGVYENRFAEFCVLNIGFCLIYSARNWSFISKNVKLFMLFSLFALGFSLLLTGSRGPFLAFISLLIYVISKNFRNKWFLIVLFASVLVAGVMIFQFHSAYTERVRLAFEEIWRYIHSGQVRGSSVGMRLEFWRIAIETTPLDHFFGKGKMPYIVIAEKFPAVRDGALFMNEFYTNAGMINAWGSDGDIPQLIGYGGYFLLLIYCLTFFSLLRAGKLNMYKIWVLSCAFFFGLGEVVFFHRIGFAMLVSCWALVSAISLNPGKRVSG